MAVTADCTARAKANLAFQRWRRVCTWGVTCTVDGAALLLLAPGVSGVSCCGCTCVGPRKSDGDRLETICRSQIFGLQPVAFGWVAL